MALRISVVVCITSFLLGILFTHWIADSLTLWKAPVTDEHLWTSASYYAILTRGSVYQLYLALAITAVGGIGLLWSFRDGEAGNLMFDGGSIFLYGTAVVVYLYSVIPSILSNFSILPDHIDSSTYPQTLRQTTLDLASSNLICSVALTGVLFFQAGRYWVENKDKDADKPEFAPPEPTSEAEASSNRGKTPSKK